MIGWPDLFIDRTVERKDGRGWHGPRASHKKLSDADVRTFRRRVAAGEQCVAVARDMGISKSYAYKLRHRMVRQEA